MVLTALPPKKSPRAKRSTLIVSYTEQVLAHINAHRVYSSRVITQYQFTHSELRHQPYFTSQELSRIDCALMHMDPQRTGWELVIDSYQYARNRRFYHLFYRLAISAHRLRIHRFNVFVKTTDSPQLQKVTNSNNKKRTPRIPPVCFGRESRIVGRRSKHQAIEEVENLPVKLIRYGQKLIRIQDGLARKRPWGTVYSHYPH